MKQQQYTKGGYCRKLTSLGFDSKDGVAENLRPQLLQGGTLWNGRTLSEGFYHQWMRLYEEVQAKGVNEVYEQAAYTWFNRLVAIRILQKERTLRTGKYIRRLCTYPGRL